MPSSSSIPPPTAPLFPYTTLFRSQEADPPRLSRFLNYNNTCGSNNDVLCVALNEPGYSFSLLIDDPDNVTSFVSVSMTARFYENDGDRKSTRLNSSHLVISYAVFFFHPTPDSSPLSLHDALPISGS